MTANLEGLRAWATDNPLIDVETAPARLPFVLLDNGRWQVGLSLNR